MRGLFFDEKEHRYTLDGRVVPGVTTLLGVLNKPALPKWAAKMVATFVAENFMDVGKYARSGVSKADFIKTLANVPWDVRDERAERGTQLHLYAEDLLRGTRVLLDDDDPLKPVVEHARVWLADWQIKPVLIEAPIGSRAHQWAGTVDLIAEYVNPYTGRAGLGIFDWKSCKRIYSSHALQLNAYAHGEFTGLGGDEHPVPPVTTAYGIHISDRPTVAYPVQFGPHIYDEFVKIAEVWHINERAEGDWRTPGTGYVGYGETGNKNYYHHTPAP